jgi:hypothetical protein
MVFGLSSRGQFGAALMILGSLAFLPTLSPSVGSVALLAAVGAVVLTAGTWLVGTDVEGPVV